MLTQSKYYWLWEEEWKKKGSLAKDIKLQSKVVKQLANSTECLCSITDIYTSSPSWNPTINQSDTYTYPACIPHFFKFGQSSTTYSFSLTLFLKLGCTEIDYFHGRLISCKQMQWVMYLEFTPYFKYENNFYA